MASSHPPPLGRLTKRSLFGSSVVSHSPRCIPSDGVGGRAQKPLWEIQEGGPIHNLPHQLRILLQKVKTSNELYGLSCMYIVLPPLYLLI
jgi:hypothetical protein